MRHCKTISPSPAKLWRSLNKWRVADRTRSPTLPPEGQRPKAGCCAWGVLPSAGPPVPGVGGAVAGVPARAGSSDSSCDVTTHHPPPRRHCHLSCLAGVAERFTKIHTTRYFEKVLFSKLRNRVRKDWLVTWGCSSARLLADQRTMPRRLERSRRAIPSQLYKRRFVESLQYSRSRLWFSSLRNVRNKVQSYIVSGNAWFSRNQCLSKERFYQLCTLKLFMIHDIMPNGISKQNLLLHHS